METDGFEYSANDCRVVENFGFLLVVTSEAPPSSGLVAIGAMSVGLRKSAGLRSSWPYGKDKRRN